MKGNTITQSHTDNRIINIKPDSLEVQRKRIKIAPFFCTAPLKLHYCSLINDSSFYRLFTFFWQGSMGGAWDSEITQGGWGGGGELWYVEAQHHLKILSGEAVFDSSG